VSGRENDGPHGLFLRIKDLEDLRQPRDREDVLDAW
jgi:hypothetical protein